MKKHAYALIAALILFAATAYAVEGDTLWTHTYGFGGTISEKAYAIIPSGDGNFMLAGYTMDYGGPGNPYRDIYLLKVNPQGDTIWTRTYGGAGDDYATSLVPSGDGGFLLVGTTNDQFLALKLDSLGNEIWRQAYGCGPWDCCYAKSVTPTDDGGFLIAGDLDEQGMGEWNDGLVVRIDAQGNLLQQYVFWGQGDNWFDKIIPSGDGNFLVAGGTYNYGALDRDMLLYKITPEGLPICNRVYGTADMEYALDIISTPDGGFLLAGYTTSDSIWDFYVVKTNFLGDTIWTRTYGRPLMDEATSMVLSNDGNYLIAGWSFMVPYIDYGDFYLVKINPQGDTLWTRTYGSPSSWELAYSGIPTPEGDYLIAGCFANGTLNEDMYLIKVEGAVPSIHISMSPENPPITIPAGGGSFSYHITVANDTSTTALFDAWIMVRLPDQSWYGPVLGPLSLTLPGYASVARLRTQNVPASAPAGAYWYESRVGDYPGVVWDTSGFGFTKSGAGDWSAGTPSEGRGSGDWSNTGEAFEIANDEFIIHNSSFIISASPNPFNPSTVASYELRVASHVCLRVYDTAGRLVQTLVDGWREAGMYEVSFDGSGLPSGVYLYRVTAGTWSETGKMILLK